MKNDMLYKNRKYSRVVLLLLAAFGPACPGIFAQKPTVAQDTTSKIRVESSVIGEYFLRNGRYVQRLTDHVRLRQDSTLVFCDTAVIDQDDATLSGHVLIEQGDSVKIFADSAFYFGLTRQSDLHGEVVLINGRQQLFTNRLHYDLENKIATYREGATLSNGKSQLTSTYGYYHIREKEVYFKGEVLATDPEFTLRTDTMSFNTETQMVRFLAPTLISQRGSRIYCEGGFYDIENNFAEFDQNPQYERDGQRGRSRKMRYNGATKEYILEGDAYIEEPAAAREVRAETIRFNTDTEKAVFVGNVDYRDSTQAITGHEVRYDSRNKQYQLTGRGRVSDPPNIIEADSIDFNNELGNGLALGNVDLAGYRQRLHPPGIPDGLQPPHRVPARLRRLWRPRRARAPADEIAGQQRHALHERRHPHLVQTRHPLRRPFAAGLSGRTDI
ncbi:MAG: hypothetical protein IPH12_20345 [Saprospirales bacterium]|nr:hypothetical protein [Saprospirales bacterium]